MFFMNESRQSSFQLKDYGKEPLVFNINRMTKMNSNFRTVLWTGEQFQLTLMSIRPGGEIGIECHENVDQFIRIESGTALVKMGDEEGNLCYKRKADRDFAIIIPAGTWHNIINIGRLPLKVYSIYAPPEHPFGVIEQFPENK